MNKEYQYSAFGEAKYPYVNQPDTEFNQDGVYHTKLLVDLEKARSDIKKIDDVIAQEVKKQHDLDPNKKIVKANKPYKTIDDDLNIPEGKVEFHFKSKFKPKLKDRKAEPLGDDIQVWGGSILSVSYEPVGYNVAGTGIGCTLRMAGCQISKLEEGTSATSGFKPVNEDGSLIV
ncbi:ssDNA-binding protein [Candidatus Pelagibacter bacterium nBUS_29]|jgi:hypothetical protein|uniref:ssDNA-binding protein n=1 Tax=Candidatus Pelagibacter bacterium nBUS_29 TaxID=3374190 RepID=UPI003EB72B59|tara:strand:+ start:346 stop:867 length:522 start_codon:yes stop_codon:yes gene_type:complete